MIQCFQLEIVNFICQNYIAYIDARLFANAHRIARRAVNNDLIVKNNSGGASDFPHATDSIAAPYFMTNMHVRPE